MSRILFIALLFASFLSYAQPSKYQWKIASTSQSLDRLARETMLVQHPNGSLFVTGYTNGSATPGLWKSTDMGANWTRVNVGSEASGAEGNSDKDLIVDDDGNLYLVSMEFRQINPSDSASEYEGKFIALGISRDAGETWEWQYVSQTSGDDRPWIAVSGNKIYATWNNRDGVYFRFSKDQGKTWSPITQVYGKGCSSHMAVSKNGTIAIRITPQYQSGYMYDEKANFVAISEDDGELWHLSPAPGNTQWSADWLSPDGIPRWVEPVAWVDSERLVHLWSEGKTLKLGVTQDLGETWTMYEVSSNSVVFFPHLSMHDNVLIASWMELTERPNPINAHIAHVDLSEKEPKITYAEPFPMDAWSYGDPNERDTGGEYFPAILLNDGSIGATTTIQVREEDRMGFSWWHLTSE